MSKTEFLSVVSRCWQIAVRSRDDLKRTNSRRPRNVIRLRRRAGYHRTFAIVAVAIFWGSAMAIAQQARMSNEQYAAARERLIRDVIVPGGIKDQRVVEAIRATPRHEFVEEKYRAQAYFDKALPIGEQQTISSPYIVSVMTQELATKPTDKVLEIGTGSGYQAAVLSPLVKEVYTIEIVQELGKNAERLLKRLGYANVHVKVGDGYKGWPEYAPFDKIIVTCSPESVPQPLVDQLADGGLMVIPVGERYQQTLTLMRKRGDQLEQEALRPTLFVPMTGTAESQRKIQTDPKNPKLVNSDFEEKPGKNGDIPGWYYQRLLTWKTETDSPSGSHYVQFDNDEPGRPSTLLQGMALDGREVPRIKLTASVRTDGVAVGQAPDELPAVTIQFFDAQRASLGVFWLGPYKGSRKWKADSKMLRVPPATREAIVSIGLYGGTGSAAFDNISVVPVGK